MSTEQNKTMARQMMVSLDGHDLAGVVAHCTPTTQFYGWAPEAMDTASYQMAMSAILAGFPDARFTVDDVIGEGDKVAVRHTLRGTHRAEFQGIPATGNPVTVSAVVIFRFENGRAAELWLHADFMGMMQQLGVVPA